MYSIIDGINWKLFYKSKHFPINNHSHTLLKDILSCEKDLLISKNPLNRKIKYEIYELQSSYMNIYYNLTYISSSEQLLMSLKHADISIPLKANAFHFELKLSYIETNKKTFYNYTKKN